jgi:hypothetical protein
LRAGSLGVRRDFGSLLTFVHSLSAKRTRTGVVVRWHTTSEVDTRGFHVYRGQYGSTRRANQTLIARKGNATRGAAYSFLDRQAPRSARLYWLQEVKRDGTRFWQGGATVTP